MNTHTHWVLAVDDATNAIVEGHHEFLAQRREVVGGPEVNLEEARVGVWQVDARLLDLELGAPLCGGRHT